MKTSYLYKDHNRYLTEPYSPEVIYRNIDLGVHIAKQKVPDYSGTFFFYLTITGYTPISFCLWLIWLVLSFSLLVPDRRLILGKQVLFLCTGHLS